MYRYIKYHVHPDGQRSETDRGIVWNVSDALELVLATKGVTWLELKYENQVTRWYPYETWICREDLMDSHQSAIDCKIHSCSQACYLWEEWIAGEDGGDIPDSEENN